MWRARETSFAVRFHRYWTARLPAFSSFSRKRKRPLVRQRLSSRALSAHAPEPLHPLQMPFGQFVVKVTDLFSGGLRCARSFLENAAPVVS